MTTNRGPEPYLISLHHAEPGFRSIADRPDFRVVFTRDLDGETHWYEGTLTVDDLFRYLSPFLVEEVR